MRSVESRSALHSSMRLRNERSRLSRRSASRSCSSRDWRAMPELDRKVAQVLAGKVVRKDLVRKVKVGATVPVYVLEYLLGRYCATDDAAAVEAGLRVVNNT